MRRPYRLVVAVLSSLVLIWLGTACTSAAASREATPLVESLARENLPVATLGVTETPQPIYPSLTPTLAAFPTSTAGDASTGQSGLEAEQSAATPCPPLYCIYHQPFQLARPIAPTGRQTIDTSYRFGSTQNGLRDPHHGVEFLNSTGTPVLAAAAGQVIYAGDDRQTLFGPYPYFYGNLIVIEHRLPGFEQPAFTLYAHLSQISVQTGQPVAVGEEIGLVGMSGVATGSHLHFEVRLGENSYATARNPELWLAPLTDESGQPFGALAGQIRVSEGIRLNIDSIVVERLAAPGGQPLASLYLQLYHEPALRGSSPWEESFAAGDLAPGWYRVRFIQFGIQEQQVEVLPGALTVVSFELSAGG